MRHNYRAVTGSRIQMELSGWLAVTSGHRQARMCVGSHASFSELSNTLPLTFEIWKDYPIWRDHLWWRKGIQCLQLFLVLDLSGKSVEAVTSADREVLPCPSNTIFLDRRNGESCLFTTKVPRCGHQSFLWQFFFFKCQGDSLPRRAVWKKTPACAELSLHFGSSRAKSLFFMKSHRKPPSDLA